MSKVKKYPEIVATTRIQSLHRPYYFKVILWRSHEAFINATKLEDDTLAACESHWRGNYARTRKNSTFRPAGRRLGTLHFARGTWDLNLISHECLHAVLHRARLLGPSLPGLQTPHQDREEEIAYELGFWVEEVFEFLAHHNRKAKTGDWAVNRPAQRD